MGAPALPLSAAAVAQLVVPFNTSLARSEERPPEASLCLKLSPGPLWYRVPDHHQLVSLIVAAALCKVAPVSGLQCQLSSDYAAPGVPELTGATPCRHIFTALDVAAPLSHASSVQ
ncbi:hypothetical protein NDU88_006611 [Pleurodeles waltl]|uniref:Secreted protein n=1 Tax=Pleurodeles waltl TaxID=8319 RepID=A0AAV7N4J3_PLEWA|nr:hypothetical protein NDU88_006611 [Pleurodeles waltl]